MLVYRNFIPEDWIMDVLKQLGFYLGNENYVVRVYAACCLERFMSMRRGQAVPSKDGLSVDGIRNTRNPIVISKSMISEVLYDMLMALNTIIKESEGINQYSIIALNRLVLISEENFNQYAENYATAVGDYVQKAVKDNGTTAYSFYVLFETIGYILGNLAKYDRSVIKAYQEQLVPKLNKIMEEGRTDIMGYAL